MIKIKRVYEPVDAKDGARFLIDRVWPRGLKKEELKLAGWTKDVAPSGALRKWFGHDPTKWPEFMRRYNAELKHNPESWQSLLQAAHKGKVTLLFGARDTEHNNAVALKKFLEARDNGD